MLETTFPLGAVVDSSSLALGGIAGALFGRYLPLRVKTTLPLIFGIITVALGASLIGKAAQLPVVVTSLIIGAFAGELLYMEKGLEKIIRKCLTISHRHKKTGNKPSGSRGTSPDASDNTATELVKAGPDDAIIIQFITLVAVFCFGSMGLFGAVTEGITGNSDILLTKAALDLFSGLIFGAVLGIRVSFIALPQFLILLALFYSATLFMPFVTPAMLANFTATGGVIFLATGLRMCGIKIFPVINMLPALLAVFLCTWLWLLIFPA